ncbi:DMT family transporter [Lysinibacillus piscis]|uniref:Transporter n=1 Tax=Lysinibacillus piscis TaxID=2518931 RepID=A0ABQ5NQG5_9BACI|nr:DMT family transporter [Lysinibacillus sp. KH24]GLC90367.1 transporter [Lysinibacillus sp. KH24]
MRKYIGELGLTIVAIIWGSGFVASAVSLEHYTPYQILAIRFLIGVILLSIIFFKRIKQIKKSTIIKGAVIGIFLYLAFALQTVGLVYTTPSKNAFLTAVNVVIVPFIALLIFKRKIDKFELFGAILAITGIGVLSLKLSGGVNFGDFLTLLCAVGFAFHIFCTAQFVKDEDPVLLTVVQMMTASILGLIVILFKGEMNFTVNFEGGSAVLYLGVFSTTIAFLLQTVAQKFTTETNAAIILSTEAFWGMIFSVIILSEVLTVKMIIGAVLILVAIIVSETKLKFLKKKNCKEIL